MEEFTDGLEITENDDSILNNDDFSSESETATETETITPASITPSPEDTQPMQGELSDVPEQLPEETPIIEESNEVPYEDLLTALTEQTEELKAVRELEEKEQDIYTTYQNMGITLIVGIGLLFGGICALILSNYLRHG